MKHNGSMASAGGPLDYERARPRGLAGRLWAGIVVSLFALVIAVLSFRYEIYLGINKEPHVNFGLLLLKGRVEVEARSNSFVRDGVSFGAIRISRLATEAYPPPQVSILGIGFHDGPWPQYGVTRLWYLSVPMFYPASVAISLLWGFGYVRKKKKKDRDFNGPGDCSSHLSGL